MVATDVPGVITELADFSLMKLKYLGPEKYEMSDVVAAASLSLQPSFHSGSENDKFSFFI